MKHFIPFIVLACFGFLLADCNKHRDEQVYELDNDSLLDAHFNFKKGSYWIYRDSLDGRMDSFFVSNNYFTKQGGENVVYDYHFISITDYNTDGSATADSSKWVFNYQNNKVVLEYNYGRNGYGWKTDINFNPLFLYPFQYGDNGSNFDSATVTGKDSFYVQNGLHYYNVATVHQYLNAAAAAKLGVTGIDDWFFVNDSVGMVKMRLSHPLDAINHVWELQRYKIVK